MPLVSEDPTNPTNSGDASPLEGQPGYRLKALEEELEDIQEQTRVALGRHTRGRKRMTFADASNGAEPLLRQYIEAIKALIRES